MKRYLIFDAFGNSQLGTKKTMKNYLVNELVDSLNNNYDDKIMIKELSKELGQLAKIEINEIDTKSLIKELDNYGWYVMDLFDLQKALTDYQAFKHGVGAPSYPNDCIEQTLKMIEEEMK